MYIIVFLLSIWQSILFFGKEPGISVILFILPFLVFLIKYLEKNGKVKNKNARLIAVPIVLLASTYFIFNDEFLNGVNKLAIPILTVIMVIELICDEFTLEKVISNIFGFLTKPIGLIGKVIEDILDKIKKKENKNNTDNSETKTQKNIKRIIKAIFISIPVVLFIFILLLTADSDFSKLFIDIARRIHLIKDKVKLTSMFERIMGIIIVFFYMTGFIKNSLLTNELKKNNKEIKSKDSLSIKFILTVLNIMYVVFCIVQVKSLFNIYTMNKNNINYSYYARQGFFQLMVVSAINIVMILKSKEECYNKEKYINVMDIIMIVLTSIILVSSFIRMYLYQQSYGFTLKRILVFWAEITEGILLIPTAMFVLNKKMNLAKAYFVIIVTMYVVLNFSNINRIIAKRNVNMYLKNGAISVYDLNELAKLGTDGMPEFVRLYDLIDETEKQRIKEQKQVWNIEQILNEYENKYKNYDKNYDLIYLISTLKETYNKTNNIKLSWQEFNISKYKARKILDTIEIKGDI